MRNTRRGFTLVEILTVLVIMGVVMMMALPKMGNMNDRNQMRSAKDGISSRLAAARAAAIATGRQAFFYSEGDSIRVTASNGSTQVAKGNTLNLKRQFGVSVSSPTFSIMFDGRGMTTGARNVIKFGRNALADSICISAIGLINRHGCAQ
ncbi:MAG: prepilin-type N-terminal cleavage/methylation domain-containing protein [Gemmatimonadaceae bacterium]|nr:prepilin-type N-terminal cleavage/methylation domain-containing protein [Gemmatimonadaceae bacterium]NUQ93963.1 prepilin-type N-terminal cleavage/methylation domain-containing protein [Gemmatimonadaceae bacterium]NUS95886.1 prepilin-type N-terminal cleavage/methylation domain-containing protein [Gemmatimonadaceae bacterium]